MDIAFFFSGRNLGKPIVASAVLPCESNLTNLGEAFLRKLNKSGVHWKAHALRGIHFEPRPGSTKISVHCPTSAARECALLRALTR